MLPAKTKTKTNPTTTTTKTKTATKTTAERSTPAAKTPRGSAPKSKSQPKSKSKADPQPQAKAKARANAKVEADPLDDLIPSSIPVLFAEPWKNIWAVVAAATGSVVIACRAAGVTLATYLAARRDDPEFEAVACVRDEVADLKIIDSLCDGAMDGDIRFQSLYFAKVRDLVIRADRTERLDARLSTAQTEVALRAMLAIEDDTTPAHEAKTMAPPSPSPSRPEARTSRDSARRPPA